MSDADLVLETFPIDFHWPTFDPFLFCAHHDDAYPAGDERMAPAASLAGRRIGMDFDRKDGWNMYHGDVVPGFPRHPHRGFETVTLARRGYIDHSDSLGATARFGHGDCQWMTAGGGIVHAEMFPLVKRDAKNPTELFQVWLNLPRADKMVDPYFTMLWSEKIPKPRFTDDDGLETEVAIIAGVLGDQKGPPPPPNSWAAHAESDIAIWTIQMEPHARWTAPPAKPGSNRTLYVHVGESALIGGHDVQAHTGARVRADVELAIESGDARTELLLLQGRPIGEPVVQYGPFVMNTPAEIRQAMIDYQRTEYGGWPWPSDGPVHPRDRGRFAVHADGREETP
jgi:redox-sensitive bicupin YhaK (pirin superfamily)